MFMDYELADKIFISNGFIEALKVKLKRVIYEKV